MSFSHSLSLSDVVTKKTEEDYEEEKIVEEKIQDKREEKTKVGEGIHQNDEYDSFFKDMEPMYVPAARIGPTKLVKAEETKSNRFDMEFFDDGTAWNVDEWVK